MPRAEINFQISLSLILQSGSAVFFFHLYSQKRANLDKPTTIDSLLINLFISRSYFYLRTKLMLGDDLYRAYGAYLLPIVTL